MTTPTYGDWRDEMPGLEAQLKTTQASLAALDAAKPAGMPDDPRVAASRLRLKQAEDLTALWREEMNNYEETQTMLKAAADIAKALKENPERFHLESESYTGPATKAAVTVGLSGAKQWAESAAEHVFKASKQQGVKALATGSFTIPTIIQPDTVPLPHNPRRLIDVLVNRQPLNGDSHTFEFLRQTVRTNNADVVADSATKPTSVFTLEPVEDRARVVAHLSEPVPERYLEDHRNMVNFLQSEMFAGVYDGLEGQLINGDGTGENFTGLLNTVGVLNQPYDTDLFTTMRKARTRLANVNEMPTAWVVNPGDAETLDLARDNAGEFLINDGITNITGNLPVIVTTSMPTGYAMLADWAQVQLLTRTQMRLDADRSGAELFDKNLFKLRAEGRWGLAVLRPQAVCLIVTAAS